MTRFQGKVINYLSYRLQFHIGMKLHDILDNGCYANSWYLKETGEIAEPENKCLEELRSTCKVSGPSAPAGRRSRHFDSSIDQRTLSLPLTSERGAIEKKKV